MPVVSNTLPLLNLAIIGQLELLRLQFGQIEIPAGVLVELRVDKALAGYTLNKAINRRYFCECTSVIFLANSAETLEIA